MPKAKSINKLHRDKREGRHWNKRKMNNKKGCGKMFCGICKEIDSTHTAHCIRHGRSIHRVCGEDKNLCTKCKKENEK